MHVCLSVCIYLYMYVGHTIGKDGISASNTNTKYGYATVAARTQTHIFPYLFPLFEPELRHLNLIVRIGLHQRLVLVFLLALHSRIARAASDALFALLRVGFSLVKDPFTWLSLVIFDRAQGRPHRWRVSAQAPAHATELHPIVKPTQTCWAHVRRTAGLLDMLGEQMQVVREGAT
jgi:hypothetical protein